MNSHETPSEARERWHTEARERDEAYVATLPYDDSERHDSPPVVYRGIYVSNDVNGYAVLKCEFCAEWEYDIDGAAIEDAAKWAEEHKLDHAEVRGA